MSGICGWVGEADPATLDRMLDAIDYRGDRVDRAVVSGAALGYRWWEGRPGKAPGIHRDGATLAACCGTFAPPVPDPAAALRVALTPAGLRTLDGAFAGAVWDGTARRLTLVRDPFGVRSLYHVTHAGTFYFASELKQLLAIPGLPVVADLVAIHKYLTFSFVPGEDVPVKGVKRVLPGRVATLEAGRLTAVPYGELKEEIDPALADQATAVRAIRRLAREAVEKRLNGEKEVGLFLSGGLDSSAVAFWLKRAGAAVRAFTLDFGEKSVEREPAELVAAHLEIPLETVPVAGADVGAALNDIAWKLDLPFGDPVTGPQYLMGLSANSLGLSAVFSGEGGDQLFGGWTSKPMLAAELYAEHAGEDSREEQYLASYHRFYGLEDDLYAPDFRAAVGTPGQRRAHLRPYVHSESSSTFLNRIRMADIFLKGSQNILPRAERMANAWGLDARVPLFDRALAALSFSIPPQLKLAGASEKHILKLALRQRLPDEVVWRRKFGMNVPVTDWVLDSLAPLVEDLLGPAAVARRGLFRTEYVERLRAGRDEPGETRRRRLGERLWALVMLEVWMRLFIDGKGRKPS